MSEGDKYWTIKIPIKIRRLLESMMRILRVLFILFIHWSVFYSLFHVFNVLTAWILFAIYVVLLIAIVGYSIHEAEDEMNSELNNVLKELKSIRETNNK